LLVSFGEQAVDFGFFGEISGERRGPTAEVLDFRDKFFGIVAGVAVMHDDICALGSQMQRDGSTEALGRTGYQSNLAGERGAIGIDLGRPLFKKVAYSAA
jgi:hypothetical protein